MKNSPKQTVFKILFIFWLVLTSMGGIILYIWGAAQHQTLYKQIAIVSFSAYFFTAGWYYAAKRRKISVLLFVISTLLLLTVFLF